MDKELGEGCFVFVRILRDATTAATNTSPLAVGKMEKWRSKVKSNSAKIIVHSELELEL